MSELDTLLDLLISVMRTLQLAQQMVYLLGPSGTMDPIRTALIDIIQPGTEEVTGTDTPLKN
jgi:hypothetical protein